MILIQEGKLMNYKIPTSFFVLIFVSGCFADAGSVVQLSDGGITRVACNSTINYDGKKVEISGVEAPISVSGNERTIKLGEFESSPVLIRKASDLIKALDFAYTSACRDVLTLQSDDAKLVAIEKRDRLIQLLTQTITSLDNATSESLVEQEVQKTQDKLENIQSPEE